MVSNLLAREIVLGLMCGSAGAAASIALFVDDGLLALFRGLILFGLASYFSTFPRSNVFIFAMCLPLLIQMITYFATMDASLFEVGGQLLCHYAIHRAALRELHSKAE
jgi:hypothetical protein